MYTRLKRLAALALLVPAGLAGAQAIDFETLPGGGSTADRQPISDQYVADFGVRFDLVDAITLESIGSPLIAKVGGAQTAFEGCGADTPLDGEGVGSSFLTDDTTISNEAGTLLLTYTDPVAQAAGVILDIDRRTGTAYEEWTVEALDASMGVIDTVVLTAPFGISPCGTAGTGSGDARALGFLFSHDTDDIHFILLRYTGNANPIGLAFDNFTPTTIPPAPTATASADITSPCVGDPITITALPEQGLPGFAYQWQQAPPMGSFTDIQGETNQTLIAPALNEGISYRAVVSDALSRQAITNPVIINNARPHGWALKVETAAGSGVYDTITTNIVPYIFDENITTIYDWRVGEEYYHGEEPPLHLDRSHMFMAIAPGGQALVVVHDSADPNTGGRAEMSASFTGATPSFMFKDDPTGDTYAGGGTSLLRMRQNWTAPNTDGWAAGPLSGSWSAQVQFSDTFSGAPTIDGLSEWYFHSSDGSTYELPLEEDRIVLIEAYCDPCPADLTNDGELDFFDVSAFLDAFAKQDPLVDFTNDGLFDFFDVSAFLDAFGAGCP
tara:strand:- start:43258 stop:44925 length:1668 start_codon:yes stop_codon:yes gene_type:complete